MEKALRSQKFCVPSAQDLSSTPLLCNDRALSSCAAVSFMSLVATDRHLGGFHAARDHHVPRLGHCRPHVEGTYRSSESGLCMPPCTISGS